VLNGPMVEGSTLHALSAGNHRRPLKTFTADRTCTEPGCATRLSVYNPAERCWQHEPARTYHPKVGRTRKTDKVSVS
jgi:hypothetical protein